LDGLTLHRETKKVESIELDEVIALSPTCDSRNQCYSGLCYRHLQIKRNDFEVSKVDALMKQNYKLMN